MAAGRLMAIDVGTARVGVAVSDPLRIIAQPLEVIVRAKTNAIERLQELVAEYEPRAIVVGVPLDQDGGEGRLQPWYLAFTQELAQKISVPIHRWDERLTSLQAERAMRAGGANAHARRHEKDKVAAALILESFMAARPDA